MHVKLLLDENLSPRVAEVLRNDDGLDAVHIRDRGLLEATDPEVGWATSTSNDTPLALDALRAALRQRRPPPGLVHHSDRGSPYASAAYRVSTKPVRPAGGRSHRLAAPATVGESRGTTACAWTSSLASKYWKS